MAASVLLLVGGPHADADGNSDGADSVGVARLQEKLIQKVVEKAKGIGKGLGPGQIGPVIDQASFEKIHKYIREAEQSGAEILLDGKMISRRDAGTQRTTENNVPPLRLSASAG